MGYVKEARLRLNAIKEIGCLLSVQIRLCVYTSLWKDYATCSHGIIDIQITQPRCAQLLAE